VTWRDRIIGVVGLLLFIVGYMWKAAGRVSFLEGTAILVGYVVIVAVIALVVEIVRKDA